MKLLRAVSRYEVHLRLTAPWVIGGFWLASFCSLLIVGTTYGVRFLAIPSLIEGQFVLHGATFVIAGIAFVQLAALLVMAPIVRAILCRTILNPVSHRYFALRARSRFFLLLHTFALCTSLLMQFAVHAALVGTPWYDSIAEFFARHFTVAAVLSVGSVVIGVVLKEFVFKAAPLSSLREFEPWTYGQINLDVGAFGTESRESHSRLREYYRARRDTVAQSDAMRRYLAFGDTTGLSWTFRTRRGLSNLRRVLDARGNREALHWKGVVSLRERLARLLNVGNPHELSLASSTTTAIRNALDCVLRSDSTVVTTDLEHPTIMTLLERLATLRPGRVKVLLLRERIHIGMSDDEILDLFSDAARGLNGSHCVWLFSHVDYGSGAILPIHRLATTIKGISRDSHVVVDGAHGPGNIEVDLRQAAFDAYAFCGHKWLNGSPGSGFLWSGAAFDAYRHRLDTEGPGLQETNDPGASGDTRSTLAMEPFITCDAYLCFLQQIQSRVVLAHQRKTRADLVGRIGLLDGVELIPVSSPSSIVAFRLHKGSQATKDLAESCERESVYFRYLPELTLARICSPYFLDDDNIGHVEAVVKRAMLKRG